METRSTNNSVGFGGLLTILFIGLKLTGYIEWSWWWVLSPIWIGLALVLVIVAVILIVAKIKHKNVYNMFCLSA
jgi:hypothetical protein